MSVSGFFDVYGAYIFPTLALLGIGHMALRLWRAARDLRAQGLPVRPAIPADALFGESQVSGHLEATFFSKISGASNCLMIWVTRQELVIEAVFPFNLFMLSMRDYLRARVPIHAVVSTQRGEGQSVLITFPDSRQEQTTLRLFLKRPSDLISALKSLKVRVI